MRIGISKKAALFSGLIFAALLLASPGCLVRKVTHIHAQSQIAPARDASLAELVSKTDAWSAGIHTMTATIDMDPSTGSIYSGVIKEYHDVRGFILLKRPSTLRLLGLTPVVRTNLFDMVSDGQEFRLSIPIKHKFFIGTSTFHHPSKNALENLRPQHILQALVVPTIDPDRETVFRLTRDRRTQPERFYELHIIEPQGKHLIPLREVTFDRADLELVRVQYYDPDGTCTEDVRYSNYQNFQGIHYPTHIDIDRPEENYQLTLTIEKALFNEDIPAAKFELKKPEGEEVVNLDGGGNAGDQ